MMVSHTMQNSRFAYLEYAGAVGSPPCVQHVVLAGAGEPFAAVGKLEREDAALV